MAAIRCLCLAASLVLCACGSTGAASPFAALDAGQPVTDGATGDGATQDESNEPDATASDQPCLDDSQCDDRIPCTFKQCDTTIGRCRFTADDARCQDGIYCNGVERCNPSVGCQPGAARDCSDDDTCTIDACVEATQSCTHTLRDADGDGVPDVHCMAGGDCDDHDPSVFPGHPEVCHNKKDDNCNGLIDETPCVSPAHDTCLDPLEVSATGAYTLDTTGAVFDYGGTCAPTDVAARDVVAAIEVPSGGPRDVDVVAEVQSGLISLGLASDCGVLSSEIACSAGVSAPTGGSVARVLGRSLMPGAYPLYLWTDRDERVVLHARMTDPTNHPTNETCATASPLTIGTPVDVSIVDATKDLATKCSTTTGDLVFSFALDNTQDIVAYATSLDGYGDPSISLRSPACAQPDDEMACNTGSEARVFARALPAGTYYLAVAASAPTDVELTVTKLPPSMPLQDESCLGAPLIAPNRTIDVSLSNHPGDLVFTCSPGGAASAAYDLELAATSDVLLLERISSGDMGSVALSLPTCGSGDSLACSAGSESPVRASLRGVASGSYRAVVQSQSALPVQLTAWVRPSLPPTLVPFSATCATAVPIGASGGLFQGNTANADANYSAGCDVIGQARAPSQMLKLELTERRRVVLDMQGSSYVTLIDVRTATPCPGVEVPAACTIGLGQQRSFLDLTLAPGDYWIQITGYGGESGVWFLDVRIGDP